MGNCISTIRQRRQTKKPLTLALLGVDNAGKTTASFSFAGEPIDPDVAPTIGFRNVKFTFDKYDITLYDIGGGKNIRPVWKNYFPEVYGVIYMVDSSTAERMDEVRETFRESLEHPHVSGKPVLLLANKQDKADALDEVDICEQLNLESVVNTNKCPCRIDTCTALRGTGKKMDPRMKEGLRWLLGVVEKQWAQLKIRVDSDVKAVDQQRKEEAAARRERVRKQREDREKAEEEERQRLGIEKRDSDEDEMLDGDPFRPLNLNQLKKKEEKLKAEKKHLKELEQASKVKDTNGEALFAKTPGSTRLQGGGVGEGDKVFSPRTRPSALPPLEPLGTPFLEEGEQGKKKKKKKNKFLQGREETGTQQTRQSQDKTTDDDEDIVMATPRSQPVLSESVVGKSVRTVSNIKVSTHDDFPARQMLAAGITRVPQSLDGGEGEAEVDTPRTRKVKKKKLRDLAANQNGQARPVGAGDQLETMPRSVPRLMGLDGEDIKEVTAGGVAGQKKKRGKKNRLNPNDEEKYELSPRTVFASSPQHQGLKMTSRHSQMHSNVSLGSDHLGSKTWGMAEDLPAVADDAIAFRQPNFANDDDAIL
ncbi:hypothetical protein V1264_015366 [Littorina saxatilis]